MSWQATSRILGHIAFCGMTICGLGCQPDATTTGQRTSSVHSSAAETKTSPVHHSGKPVWQKHADTEKYVGTQACAACHAGISQTYETHPMSHSLFLAKDLPLVSENTSDSFDPPGPCRYLISRDEHGLSQTEEFLDQSGEVVYRDTVPVQYAVGSGQRGWSFLTDRGEVLTQGVAAWYSTRSVWDLSPGYRPEKHQRFSRRVSDGCVTCHAGRTNSILGEPNRFGSPAFAELNIGCERCHGPGKDHVDFRASKLPPKGTDPIVNPASLGFAEQLSICYQCHLHGEERIVRSGRSEFDFRPGELLSDVWVTFVSGSGIHANKTTEAVSQVEQMHDSRCFTESERRMTCATCHDPHRSPAPEERVEFYRSQCLSCHEKTDSSCALDRSKRLQQVASDSCIDCHMPSVSAFDVPHTAQTDHRVIRVRQLGENQASRVGSSFMDLSLFPIPESEQRRARGLRLANKAQRTNNPTMASSAILLLTPLADVDCVDIPALDALATSYELIGDVASAQTLLTKALKLAPRNESVLQGLLTNSQHRGQPEESLRYLNKLHQLYPDDGRIVYQLAQILNQLGRTTEAWETVEKAVQLLPNDLTVRAAAVQLARKLGQTEVADAQQAIIDRMLSATAAASAGNLQPSSKDR